MSSGYFEFWARTRLHCAAGVTVRLPALLQSLDAKRVLLISDKGLEKIGMVETVAAVLREAEAGNQLTLAGVYCDVLPDAGSNSINAATAYARSVAADAIVALGGGSAMDVAKGVKYSLAHGLTDICTAIGAGMRIEPTGEPMGIAHISIPTTAGTGSEVTTGAVIFNDNTGVKALLVAPYLDSDIALLDANLCLGLPPAITADTGMDALTHAIEALVCPASNALSNSLAIGAIDQLLNALPLAVQNGKNLQAREDMLQAASMATWALNNAIGAAPVHNCSHALGALYHIPHGRANGVLLPVVMTVLRDFYLPYADTLAKAFGLAQGEPGVVIDAVIARIKALQQSIGMPVDFSEFNIPSTDLRRISGAIASDPLAMLYQIPPDKVAAIVKQVVG